MSTHVLLHSTFVMTSCGLNHCSCTNLSNTAATRTVLFVVEHKVIFIVSYRSVGGFHSNPD